MPETLRGSRQMPTRPTRSHGYPKAHYARVAKVYEVGGTDQVALEWAVSPRTARRWVLRARGLELLPWAVHVAPDRRKGDTCRHCPHHCPEQGTL